MNKPSHLRVPVIPFILVLFSLHISCIKANIQKLVLTNETGRNIYLQNFAFTSSGRVYFNVSSVSIGNTNKSFTTNLSHIGLVLSPIYEDENEYRSGKRKVEVLFTLSELLPPPQSFLSKTIPVKLPGAYQLYIGNGAHRHGSYISSMNIHLEAYNLDSYGRKDYLCDGERQLPMLFFIFSLLYVAFITFWSFLCHKNKTHVQKIHHLMTILLVVKALNLVIAFEDKYHIKITGSPRSGWDIWLYAFQSIQGTLFFIVMVLMATDWSSLRSVLKTKEKLVLMIGIPVQVLDNIAYIVLSEMSPTNWWTWLFGLVGMDIALFFLIVIPISWSLRRLRDDESRTNGEAVAILNKMKHFRDFYIMVYMYMIFTKVALYKVNIVHDIHEYKTWWTATAGVEVGTILFYIVLFYMYRPMEANQYLAVAADEEEEENALVEMQSTEYDVSLVFKL